MLQVPLHDDVADGSIERGGDDERMAMPEVMHADSADHVVFHASVGKFYQRPVADAASQIWIVKFSATKSGEALNRLFVVGLLRRIRRADTAQRALMILQRIEKKLARAGHAGIGSGSRSAASSGAILLVLFSVEAVMIVVGRPPPWHGRPAHVGSAQSYK